MQGHFEWDARMCVDTPQNQGPAQASARRANTPAGAMSASRQNMFGEGPEAGLWERYTNPLQPELSQRRASYTSGLVESMPSARDATMGQRVRASLSLPLRRLFGDLFAPAAPLSLIIAYDASAAQRAT